MGQIKYSTLLMCTTHKRRYDRHMHLFVSTIHSLPPSRTRFYFVISLNRESCSLTVSARDVVISIIDQSEIPRIKGRWPIYTGRAKTARESAQHLCCVQTPSVKNNLWTKNVRNCSSRSVRVMTRNVSKFHRASSTTGGKSAEDTPAFYGW